MQTNIFLKNSCNEFRQSKTKYIPKLKLAKKSHTF